MPFEITWEKRGFYSRFWGLVSDWEIACKNISFSNDPRCDNCAYQIFDGTDVEAFLFSDGDITKFASNDIGMSTYLKNLSVALVGSKPEIIETYQSYIATCQRAKMPWDFHICETLDQAREWLRREEAKNRPDSLRISPSLIRFQAAEVRALNLDA